MIVSRRQVLAMGGAAATFTPRALRAQTAPIRMGQTANESFGEGLFAAAHGNFKTAGLNIEISIFLNGAAQTAALAGDAIDVGLGDALELANGIVHGLPFAAFAGGALYDNADPTSALIVAANSSFGAAKDFEGQTIAVAALASLSDYAVRQWLVLNGADLSKVRFIELPASAQVPAILRGTVAAAHVSGPNLNADAKIRRIAAPYGAVANLFLINVWFASRDWLNANAATARRLAGAIYDTARWLNANHDASAPILANFTKIDVDKIRTMKRFRYATTLEPRLIQPVLDLALKYGGLPRHLDAAEIIVP